MPDPCFCKAWVNHMSWTCACFCVSGLCGDFCGSSSGPAGEPAAGGRTDERLVGGRPQGSYAPATGPLHQNKTLSRPHPSLIKTKPNQKNITTWSNTSKHATDRRGSVPHGFGDSLRTVGIDQRPFLLLFASQPRRCPPLRQTPRRHVLAEKSYGCSVHPVGKFVSEDSGVRFLCP